VQIRIPLLLQTPAAVRFLSCEPLLGPVDLKAVASPHDPYLHCLADGVDFDNKVSRIDWVIVGGESGPGARPMHPDWARSMRDECAAFGVPFFFKQWGEWMRLESSETAMKRVGKKVAGRELEGRTWDQIPDVQSLMLSRASQT